MTVRPDIHRSLAAGMAWLATGIACALFAACGPIEPEQPPPNAPPHIEPSAVRPQASVVRVDSSQSGPVEQTLQIQRLLDPNAEESLFGVWFGDERGFISQFESERTGTTSVADRTYRTFEGTARTLQVCDPEAGLSNESIWLFVSDGRFREVTNQSVTAGEDAFMVSWTWTIKCL
ncbi:MAG: hypothetical protein ABEL76_05950 [Bradymonadaceae bacterium]